MKTVIPTILVALALFQCGPNSAKKAREDQQAAEQDIRLEKEKMTNDLRALRNDIDRRLETMQRNIKVARQRNERQLDGLRDSLATERARIDQSLQDIGKSTKEAWHDTRIRVRRTLDDASRDVEKIKRKMEEAFK